MKKGWKIEKLGDVCEVIAGQSPKSTFYNTQGIGLPFYQGKKEFKEKYLGSPTTWTTKTTKIAIENDILMSVRAPVGPVNITKAEICIGRGLAAIRNGKSVDNSFLYFYMLENESKIEGGRGSVFDSISTAEIRKFQIPIPPLAEQKQIVAKLDKAFAAIDKAEANTKQNIENAKELFQSRLDEIFTIGANSKGWVTKKLGDVCEKTANIKWETEINSYKYIDLTSVSRDTLKIEDYKSVNKENAPSRAKKIVLLNDVIFGTTRPTLKRVALIDDIYQNQICSTGFAVLRANNEISNSKLIYFFIQSSIFMDRMEKVQRGTSYPAVTDKDVKDTIIPFPTNNKRQEKIVKELDKLREATDKLVANYEKKLSDLAELRKSLLEQAFLGNLS
jgi:type I restriction enzyme S subunit